MLIFNNFLRNKNINIGLNFFALYLVVDIVGSIVLMAFPIIFRGSGVEVSKISIFYFFCILPWSIKFIYSAFIERIKLGGTRRITIFILSCYVLCSMLLFSLGLLDISSFILITILLFISQTLLTFNVIILNSYAIDRCSNNLINFINMLQVFCTSFAKVSVGIFMYICSQDGLGRASLLLSLIPLICSIPTLFLYKMHRIDDKKLSEIIPYKFFDLIRDRKIIRSIFLIFSINSSSRLAMFAGGIFMVDKNLSQKTIAIFEASVMPFSPIIGSMFGMLLLSRLKTYRSIVFILIFEFMVYGCYLLLSFNSHPTLIMCITFVAMTLYCMKFVFLYSFIMFKSRGHHSAINFSLLSSFDGVVAIIMGFISGSIISIYGYKILYTLCIVTALIGLFVVMNLLKDDFVFNK